MIKMQHIKKHLAVYTVILLALPTTIIAQDSLKFERERNIEMKKQSRFEKGNLFVGGNLSFGEVTGENDYIVANVDLLNVDKSNVNLSFVGGYFLNKLMSIGLRGSYGFSKSDQTMEADFLNIAFNATTYKTQNLKDKLELHTFIRNYVPMGNSGNFYIFSETSLYYLGGTNYQRATRNPGMNDENISTIFARTNGLGLGVSLGTTFFSAERFAFELQLGTTGLEVAWKDIEKERVEQGTSRKITFRNGLSVLNIQMGFTYYIPSFKKQINPKL